MMKKPCRARNEGTGPTSRGFDFSGWAQQRLGLPVLLENDALTDFTDLLPTFVDLAGSRLPDGPETDGVSLAVHLLGKAGDSGREWIMALGHGPARLDAKGVRGVHDFAPRVIRDMRFKVWVNSSKTIDRLHDLKADPWETTNLLDGGLNAEQQAALRKFQQVLDRLPDRDARPLYEPRTPNPWDQKAPVQGDGIQK